jgi:predicted methyltransferase MtxX (methanogen marker protein 4)
VDRPLHAEPPQIGAPLDSLRAAIDVVAEGAATRVTVHVPHASRLLPAASQLAKRAGVRVELVDPTDREPELTVLPIAASGR